MASFKIKKLRTIFIIYWFLLAYIFAALIWWFIALDQQNKTMTAYKIQEVSVLDIHYHEKISALNNERRRKVAQYIGEGSTFFLLIIAGAVFVFRAVRRQFRQTQQQQNFMVAVTHELKTPIAVTKLNLETLLKHNLPEETRQKLISNTLQEANRLNDLCSNMLLAGQLEAGRYTLTKEENNLSELVNESIHEYAARFPQRILVNKVSEDIFLSGDALLLKIAVNNLLDNAIKYSPKEGSIVVELKNEIKKIIFSISDEGKGIADDEKLKVFDKFYRIGNQHTKESKGTGLGLFLTKTIIKQHNGTISVFNNIPHGSVFEISFAII